MQCQGCLKYIPGCVHARPVSLNLTYVDHARLTRPKDAVDPKISPRKTLVKMIDGEAAERHGASCPARWKPRCASAGRPGGCYRDHDRRRIRRRSHRLYPQLVRTCLCHAGSFGEIQDFVQGRRGARTALKRQLRARNNSNLMQPPPSATEAVLDRDANPRSSWRSWRPNANRSVAVARSAEFRFTPKRLPESGFAWAAGTDGPATDFNRPEWKSAAAAERSPQCRGRIGELWLSTLFPTF